MNVQSKRLKITKTLKHFRSRSAQRSSRISCNKLRQSLRGEIVETHSCVEGIRNHLHHSFCRVVTVVDMTVDVIGSMEKALPFRDRIMEHYDLAFLIVDHKIFVNACKLLSETIIFQIMSVMITDDEMFYTVQSVKVDR